MKIIALAGVSNSGKTTTLKKVYDFLDAEGKTIFKESKWRKEQRGIFSYRRKIVCITTRGDSKKILDDDFRWFDKHHKNIDIYICPCHTKGKTIQYVRSKAKKCEDAYIFEKCYLHNSKKKEREYDCHFTICDDINKKQAEYLINFIKKII